MDCRPRRRASRSPTSAWSSCPTRSRTTRRSSSRTFFRRASMAADLAEIREGTLSAVFGCGPVDNSPSASAKQLGAGRVIADRSGPDRLERRAAQGAEVVDFSKEDPVETDRASYRRHRRRSRDRRRRRRREPSGRRRRRGSRAGDQKLPPARREGPAVAARLWADPGAGVGGGACRQSRDDQIGVYPPTVESSIGQAIIKNLTIRWATAITASTSRASLTLPAAAPSTRPRSSPRSRTR